jgi:hypothetical protein
MKEPKKRVGLPADSADDDDQVRPDQFLQRGK